jgi:hypothetical protein
VPDLWFRVRIGLHYAAARSPHATGDALAETEEVLATRAAVRGGALAKEGVDSQALRRFCYASR